MIRMRNCHEELPLEKCGPRSELHLQQSSEIPRSRGVPVQALGLDTFQPRFPLTACASWRLCWGYPG